MWGLRGLLFLNSLELNQTYIDPLYSHWARKQRVQGVDTRGGAASSPTCFQPPASVTLLSLSVIQLSTQSLTQLQSLTQHKQLFISASSSSEPSVVLHPQQFQVGTSVIPPVVIDVVDLSSWWYWEAIQIHPQLFVEVFLVPGCWHIDGPVPASQVLRKWVLSHVQRNIICQAPIQQDPAHMNPPPNLRGTSISPVP